jgi:bifunctional DNA-binding transcriptional regulator/antitoxin component of YhaV-PrlF toxin-antitoxin module
VNGGSGAGGIGLAVRKELDYKLRFTYSQIAWYRMNANVTRIDPAGRLSISAQHRKALGLESGGAVVVTLVGDEVRIRSMATAMNELQADAARFLQDEQSSVDAFIAERHAEVVRDEGEFNDEPPPLPLESVARAAKKPERKVAR